MTSIAIIRSSCKTRAALATFVTPGICSFCEGKGYNQSNGSAKWTCNWCISGKQPLPQADLVKVAKVAKELGCTDPRIDAVVKHVPAWGNTDEYTRREGGPRRTRGWTIQDFYNNAAILADAILA